MKDGVIFLLLILLALEILADRDRGPTAAIDAPRHQADWNRCIMQPAPPLEKPGPHSRTLQRRIA